MMTLIHSFFSSGELQEGTSFIPSIRVGQDVITDQQGKEQSFFSSYNMLLGMLQNRDYTLDFAELGLRSMDLSELDAEFTEQEVWEVIKEMPQDRASGPYGFIGAFYRHAWQWIRQDVMAALSKFHRGDGRCFGKLNSALITLIPKKEEALDYWRLEIIALLVLSTALPSLAPKSLPTG